MQTSSRRCLKNRHNVTRDRYRDKIVQHISTFGKAKKRDIREWLWDMLPAFMDDKQKNRKISTLLTSLRLKGIITTDSPNQQISNWILVEQRDNSNKKQ